MDVGGLGFALGVTPYDEAPSPLIFDPVFTAFAGAVCAAGTRSRRSDVGVACEVIDMEAYALAKVCWHEKCKICLCEYVTDVLTRPAADDWQAHVHKAARGVSAIVSWSLI